MNKKGVIFDLDGTLWNASEQVVPAWNNVLKRYHELNKQITVEDMNSFFGKTLESIAALLLPDIEASERLRVLKECCSEEQVYLREHGGVLYPNLEKTLSELKADYSLYIVSNCQDGYVDAFLDHHQLRSYFDDYEMSGRTGKDKGANIRMVIDRNRLEKAVYVGDTIGDLNGADEAGISFVYASYGFGELKDCVHSISKIEELPALLREIL